ncbi:MAG TPA: radical SAM protein [Thermofilum sp.]|nr:radical SAM protein [Thermofilum sp.]
MKKKRNGTFSIRLSNLSRHNFFYIDHKFPLLGHIAFGIIDRGTNLLQVRPTSLCPLSCIFCSVDAGPLSKTRATEYIVDIEHLTKWFSQVAEYKGEKVQAHIDAAGDPLTHPKIVELVKKLRKIKFTGTISMETHGALLTIDMVNDLDDAGLDRLNLSIDALDPSLARRLAGADYYNIERVIKVARYVASSLKMDLLIAPVWVPGLNDEEIPRIIEFALEIGAGKRWPPLGIQKYEAHKYGRKPKGVKPIKWFEFYRRLEMWEQEYGVKLVLKPEDFGIKKAKRVPFSFRRGETARVKVVGPGWLRNEWLAVARNRLVSVVGVEGSPPVGRGMRVEIISVKDGIYLGAPL